MQEIETLLTDKHSMTEEKEEMCEEFLKHEFQFFKDLSNIGIKIREMIKNL